MSFETCGICAVGTPCFEHRRRVGGSPLAAIREEAEKLLGDLSDFVTGRTREYKPMGLCARSAYLIRSLLDQLQEQEKREAECHAIIAALWAITDPDMAVSLHARIDAALGAHDKDGRCGNRICAELAAAEASLAAQAQRMEQVSAEMRTAVESTWDDIDDIDLQVGRWADQLSDLATSVVSERPEQGDRREG